MQKVPNCSPEQLDTFCILLVCLCNGFYNSAFKALDICLEKKNKYSERYQLLILFSKKKVCELLVLFTNNYISINFQRQHSLSV